MPVAVQQPKIKKVKKDKKVKKQNAAVKSATPGEIEIVQEDVVKYSSRLHVTSAVFIALGAIGAAGSAYHGFNARRTATKLLGGHQMNNTDSHEAKPEFVSSDMFALVDNIRIISTILFITFMSIACMGKMALRSTHKLKAKFSNRVFKRSICRVIFVIFMMKFARSYIKECK